jgi:hypothetical protein
MVLDTSGSMAWGLDGNTTPSPSDSRIYALRTQAAALITKFAVEDNIDIKLVPFNTSANDSDNSAYVFRNAKTGQAALLTAVSGLTAGGGTNTGDGLRRAYWALYNHNQEVGTGVRASNYLIVLVDGVTTFASVNTSTDSHGHTIITSFVTQDGTVNEARVSDGGQIAGNGAYLDTQYGEPYVDLIGEDYIQGFARVYVIGFSAKATELDSVDDIAAACGSDNVYTADSATALSDVFSAIEEDIVNDLWYLQGPKL